MRPIYIFPSVFTEEFKKIFKKIRIQKNLYISTIDFHYYIKMSKMYYLDFFSGNYVKLKIPQCLKTFLFQFFDLQHFFET